MVSNKGGGKSKLDLSDIMSMLDEGGQTKPEPKPAKKAEVPKAEPPKAEPPKDNALAPKDNAFTQKLLADIERKNAENLKLTSENMSLKYALSEKDVEMKKLRAQSEALKAQVTRLSQQAEDMSKYVSDARLKLGEMESDRAKLAARAAKEDEAPPGEEDVASIFRRISSHDEPHSGQADDSEGGAGEPLQKKLKTAKLYDL